MELPKHRKLRAYLLDGELDHNPYKIRGFVPELHGFIDAIPEPPLDLPKEFRRRYGLPQWEPRQQVYLVLETIRRMVPRNRFNVDKLAEEIDSSTSFYDISDVRSAVPTNSHVRSRLYEAGAGKGVIYDFEKPGWDNLLAILLPYYLSGTMETPENRKRMSRAIEKTGSHHAITHTSFHFGPGKTTTTIQVKLHSPVLRLSVSDPRCYAACEYHWRMHETVHAFESLKNGVLFGIGNEHMAESISYLTLLNNGIEMKKDKLVVGDPYSEGEHLAFEAMEAKNPHKALVKLLKGLT